VVFDGAGNHRLFDVMASKYHIFDGLTIRTPMWGFLPAEGSAGRGRADRPRNCRFENVVRVWTEYAGSSDFYIADNLFLGATTLRLIGVDGPRCGPAPGRMAPLADQLLRGKVYGPGH